MRPSILILLATSFVAWVLVSSAHAGAADEPGEELKQIRAELKSMREQLDKQGAMIRNLYEFTHSDIQIEKWLKEKRKEREEDHRLVMTTLHEVNDSNLTSCGQAHPTAPLFAALTAEGGIRFYNGRGEAIRTFKQPAEVMTVLSYSPDGKLLLAGTQSGQLLVWDVERGTCETVAKDLGTAVGRVAWVAGTDRIAWGNMVSYWGENSKPINRDKPSGSVIERATGKTCWTFQAFVRPDFQTLGASPDGSRLAVLEIPDKPRGASLLDSKSGNPLLTLFHGEYSSGPLSVCVGPDNNTIAVGYAPTDVIIWDAGKQRVRRILEGHTNWVVSLAFSKDGRFLISGAGDSTARMWDLDSGKEIGRIRVPGSSTYIEAVGLSPDAKTAFALCKGKLVIAAAPNVEKRKSEK